MRCEPVRPPQYGGLSGLHRRHHPGRCGCVTEPPRDTMDRVGGADCMHERVDTLAGLSPDLLAEGNVAAHGVLVVHLVRPPVPGTCADLRGGDHPSAELLGDLSVAAGLVADLRAEREHGLALLGAERVGEDHVRPVPEGRTDQGEGDARRSGGVLHDGCRRAATDRRTRPIGSLRPPSGPSSIRWGSRAPTSGGSALPSRAPSGGAPPWECHRQRPGPRRPAIGKGAISPVNTGDVVFMDEPPKCLQLEPPRRRHRDPLGEPTA